MNLFLTIPHREIANRYDIGNVGATNSLTRRVCSAKSILEVITQMHVQSSFTKVTSTRSLIQIVRNVRALRLTIRVCSSHRDRPTGLCLITRVFQLRIHWPQRETRHSISNSIIRNDIVEQHARPPHRIHGKDFPRWIARMNAYRIIAENHWRAVILSISLTAIERGARNSVVNNALLMICEKLPRPRKISPIKY